MAIPITIPALAFLFMGLALVLPPVALTLGIAGKTKIARHPDQFKGGWLATLGIVTSVLSLLFMIAGLVILVILLFMLL